MRAEITPAAVVLLAFIVGLFTYDLTAKPRNTRLLLVELVVFAAGATLILFPWVSTALAHRIGIGRGVDFVLYVLVIWLVRESLLTRRRRREEEERFTELVRTVAILEAKKIDAPRVNVDRAS